MRSQRVRITRVRVEPKVHPICQKIRAPRMLHPGQRFQARVTRRNCGVLNRLSPPKTTSPNNPCHGISFAGEDPIGGDSAQPQPESLPRWTLPVVKTLANDPDFIQAGFHIGRFITVVLDTEADHLNTEALQTELESTSTRIYVSSPCIIVHCHLYSILTSPFRSELNWAF
jgi:hypothetical protein